MPRPHLPPMTTRKAKRLHQKSGKKFQFTATQFKAAERRDLLEERRQAQEAKEERRKANKRKREDKEERERGAKKRQLEAGKLRAEDTWGKVAASQPRLNAFFRKPGAETTITIPEESEVDTSEHSESEYDSQGDTCVDPSVVGKLVEPENTSVELVPFFGIQSLQYPSDMQSQIQKMSQPHSPPQPESQKAPGAYQSSPPTDPDQDLLDAQLDLSQSIWDFVIAEDNSADLGLPVQNQIPHSSTPPGPRRNQTSSERAKDTLATPSPLKRKIDDCHYSSFVSPSKSVCSARSALSEMSPSKVNVRALEKPDTTSTPKPESGLPSPQLERIRAAETPADILALISTQDLEDDAISPNKENIDPWFPASKKKSPSPSDSQYKNRTGPTGQNISFGSFNFSDCDDHLEFDTEKNDFDDDGLDDATFAGLSTQMPAKNTFVSSEGSPKKARQSNARPAPPLFNVAPVQTLPVKTMPPPPLPKHSQPKIYKSGMQPPRPARPFAMTNSFSFDGVEDDDLADLADQLESGSSGQSLTTKKPRMLPWEHPSQFPPPSPGDTESLTSTQEDD